MDESIALIEISKHNRRKCVETVAYHHIEVGLKIWFPHRCVCAPYNADFDGDEMNMHLPQTEEARAEASALMNVATNICTPRNGEPLVAATQDFVTASFLVTQRDVFFDRDEFCALAAYAGDASERVDIPPPAVLRPVQLWTGKQLFGLLVRPNASGDWPCVSFECAERNYSGKDVETMCPMDGYVLFRRSQLLCGNVAKKTVGDGCKKGLIQGRKRVRNSQLQRLISRSFSTRFG